MVKVSPGDIKAILRQFAVDGADETYNRIENIKTTNPYPVSTLVSFRFNKRRYCLVYDETADDDLPYLEEQVKNEIGSDEGAFLLNPSASPRSYALYFEGKTIYLYLAQADKKRLDLALADLRPETSRSTWQKHIKAGRVSVNGATTTSPKQEVTPSDHITIDEIESTDHSQQTIPIIYQDDNVLVINKPVGILAHAKGAVSDEFTVADFFRRYTSVGLDTNRPGIIHRLDRDTSGVMIGAKTETAAVLLARQFADRKTKKTYVAVVSGILKEKEASLELPIGRNPSAPSTFRVDSKGKMAITNYTVLAEHDGESVVELRPVTGRTHQLRVHMAYLGAPIKGDRVYGRESDRLYLHAHSLEITIPTSDRRVFTAPLPAEFTSYLETPYETTH